MRKIEEPGMAAENFPRKNSTHALVMIILHLTLGRENKRASSVGSAGSRSVSGKFIGGGVRRRIYLTNNLHIIIIIR